MLGFDVVFGCRQPTGVPPAGKRKWGGQRARQGLTPTEPKHARHTFHHESLPFQAQRTDVLQLAHVCCSESKIVLRSSLIKRASFLLSIFPLSPSGKSIPRVETGSWHGTCPAYFFYF